MKELRAMRQSVHLPSEGPLDPVVDTASPEGRYRPHFLEHQVPCTLVSQIPLSCILFLFTKKEERKTIKDNKSPNE